MTKYPVPQLAPELVMALVDVANLKSCVGQSVLCLQVALHFLCNNVANAGMVCAGLSKAILHWGALLEQDLTRLSTEVPAAQALSAKPEDGTDEDDQEGQPLALPSLSEIVHEGDNQSFLNRLLRIAAYLKSKNVALFGNPDVATAASLPFIYTDLDQLWDVMSACLAAISKHDRSQRIVSTLSPAIECFFISHSDLTVVRRGVRGVESGRFGDSPSIVFVRKDGVAVGPSAFLLNFQRTPEYLFHDHDALSALFAQTLEHDRTALQVAAEVSADSYTLRIVDESYKVPADSIHLTITNDAIPAASRLALLSLKREERFLSFIELHKAVINEALRRSPHALSKGPFAVLTHHPHVLDFRVKEKFFRELLAKRLASTREHHGRLRLQIKR